MAYTKRLLSPKFYKVAKKQNKFVVTPKCGPHSRQKSMPLAVAMRDLLHIADSISEVRKILNSKSVKIDNTIRTDHRFSVGFMDVVSVNNEIYRVLVDKNGLCIKPIEKSQSNAKLLKITGKNCLKKKMLQLGFHDGRTLLVEKDMYKVGDVVLFDLESNKIKDHIPLKRGSTVLVIDGKNKGKMGKVEDFITVRSSQPNKVVVRFGEELIETYKDYVFIIGQDAPAINLGV